MRVLDCNRGTKEKESLIISFLLVLIREEKILTFPRSYCFIKLSSPVMGTFMFHSELVVSVTPQGVKLARLLCLPAEQTHFEQLCKCA